MADFPTGISTWTNKTDGVDYPEADDVNQPNNEVIAIQNYLIESATSVTVSAGVLTVTKSRHTVQPESGTSDDIDTITGIPDNGELILSAADLGTDTLVFKHGTGNLSLPAATDITLTTGAVRFYRKGSTVYAQGGGGSGGGGGDKYPMEARLTLETGVPISTTDQTAKTTLYLTKYKGDQIAVYDGSAWSVIALGADLSITLAGLTASLPYDVFVYSNSGTLTLELTAWTNTTTRATALTTQNGVLVKTGATTRRYVGTICITATTGQCEDSTKSRLVWNYYNRVTRNILAIDTTDSWTYTTLTWRASNNSTALGVGRADFVIGVAEVLVEAMHMSGVSNASNNWVGTGIALDATNTSHASLSVSRSSAGVPVAGFAIYKSMVAAGYHYLQRTEIAEPNGTQTWFGDSGLTFLQTGMNGTLQG